MEQQIKIISHRANLNGPDSKTENTIECITNAIQLGFDVEIDIWYTNEELYLGHDFDKTYYYHNIKSFLLENSSKLWIHCKNIDALIYLLKFKELNIFGHNNDDYVLTSHHNIFCKPGVKPNKNSIIVLPEITPIYTKETLNNCYGILTDYPKKLKEDDLALFLL